MATRNARNARNTSNTRTTNVQFVNQLMEQSAHGALAQLFILDAIGKYAKMVADTPIETVREKFGEHFLIGPDAWHSVAKEIDRKLTERFEEGC